MHPNPTHWLACAALALAAPCLAQGPAPAPPQERTPAQDTAPTYAEVEADFQKAVQAAADAQRKAIEEAIANGASSFPAMSMGPPAEVLKEYLPKFKSGAESYAGRDEAIPFHLWVLRYAPLAGDEPALEASLNTLMKAHIQSKAMRPVPAAVAMATRTLGKDRAEGMLRRIEKENPDPDVQALAVLARVRPVLAVAAVTSADYQAARKEAAHAMKLAADASIDGEIQGILDGREKLVDGGIAPDILGVDLDGVAFKLSDYRGKIVMLDFWGDW